MDYTARMLKVFFGIIYHNLFDLLRVKKIQIETDGVHLFMRMPFKDIYEYVKERDTDGELETNRVETSTLMKYAFETELKAARVGGKTRKCLILDVDKIHQMTGIDMFNCRYKKWEE